MENSAFLRRQASAPKNAHGKTSEARLAKKTGGRLTPASGAMRGAKGDMTLQTGTWKFLGEAKSTIHMTLPVDYAWLVKITHEARSKGARPLLTMSFVTPEGKARPNGDWVAMPLAEYQELMEALEHGSKMDE
jgi:hypothetical protein